MGVVIKKIQLKNWFGYKGDYDANTFEFLDGVNIVVATNDVGKSKLHNAFRWIIEDKVILKNVNTNKHEIISINSNNIKDILNNTEQNSLKLNDEAFVGVKITYETTIRDEKKIKILTKEILCKKDIEVIVVDTKHKVEKVERGNVRTAPESFEDCIRDLMRNNLKDYFLVQGENVENLTALKGSKLADTINLLVGLDKLDNKQSTSEYLAKQLKKLKDDIERRDNARNATAQNNVKIKQDLINRIESISENKNEIEGFIIENERIIQEFSAQAQEAEERKKLKKEIEAFNNKKFYLEGNSKALYKSFVESCINSNFWISKLTDNTIEQDFLDKTGFAVRDYVANRRAELDDRLDKQEQKMLAALERDQPSPVILEKMIVEGQCYVCSQKLSKEGKSYIKEKLIPYFKKELNHDDKQLTILVEVHDFIKKCQGYLNKYSTIDNDFVKEKKDEIISIEKNIKEVEEQQSNFIESYGNVEDNNDDSITLATYSKALVDDQKFKNHLKEIQKELEIKKREVKDITSNGATEEESKQFIQVKNLYEFSNLLTVKLIELKNEEYSLFCNKLEEISNKKWKAFTKSNKGLNKQEIKVKFETNAAHKAEFEISVVDQFGNNSNQGGGASQSIRQLSVIFGLIEIAGGRVDYPFIADAPTSNTTIALTEEFFNYQLDNSQNQNILITKELWDDKKNDLNSAGHSILDKIHKIPNARFITITNGDKKNKLIKTIK